VEKIIVEDALSDKVFDPCETYERRLDKMETNIGLRHKKQKHRFKQGTYSRWFNEAHRIYMNGVRDNEMYTKIKKDLCVIIPTHRHHRVWNKACLESVSKLGYFTIFAYDNPYFKGQPHDVLLPPSDVMGMADYISMKPKTWHSGVGVPHIWNMLFAVNVAFMLGFEYVFSINGDFIMEKPQNFEKLRELMGDGDMFPLAWNPNVPACGTAAYIAKTEHQVVFWRDEIRTLYKNIGNCEARLGKYYKNNNLKVVHFEPGKLSHQMPNPDSTWYRTVGLRHLHAEHKIRRWGELDPIERKYFDERYLTAGEKKTLLQFWMTKNKKFLKAWWGKR